MRNYENTYSGYCGKVYYENGAFWLTTDVSGDVTDTSNCGSQFVGFYSLTAG